MKIPFVFKLVVETRKANLQTYIQLNLDYLHSQGLGRVKQMIESRDNPKYEYQWAKTWNWIGINQYYAKNLRCIFKSLPKFAKVFTNTFYGNVYDLKCWPKSVCFKLLQHMHVANSNIHWGCINRILSTWLQCLFSLWWEKGMDLEFEWLTMMKK